MSLYESSRLSSLESKRKKGIESPEWSGLDLFAAAALTREELAEVD